MKQRLLSSDFWFAVGCVVCLLAGFAAGLYLERSRAQDACKAAQGARP